MEVGISTWNNSYKLDYHSFKDYFFFLQTSGVFVIIMIVASCLCCCSGGCLCTSGMPKGCRICGVISLLIGVAATVVFMGWVALGTYFVLKIRGADTICHNTITYLALMYLYLLVLLIVGVVICLWQCNDWRRNQFTKTTSPNRFRQRKMDVS